MEQRQEQQTWFHGIDAFLFDLGRVLLDFSHEDMMQRMAAVTGLSAAALRRCLFDERLLHALESGHISEAQFIATLRSAAGREFGENDMRTAMADIFTPITETVELLPLLAKAGKRLVLVSNTSSIHFDHEERTHAWLRGFHAHILSYRIGHMKPAPEFYAAALQAAEASPERCLFIDDIAENIAGARDAGFQTHHFTDRAEFLRKFPRL